MVVIDIPPLRERPEDLPPLIEHLLAAAAARLGRPPKTLAPGAYRALIEHDWPGNVRQLEHVIEQAVVLASGPAIGVDDLPAGLRPAAQAAEPDGPPGSFRAAKQQVIERFERQFLTAALARHRGNVSRAADEMGMYRQQLQQKLAEYGIDAERFRGS